MYCSNDWLIYQSCGKSPHDNNKHAEKMQFSSSTWARRKGKTKVVKWPWPSEHSSRYPKRSVWPLAIELHPIGRQTMSHFDINNYYYSCQVIKLVSAVPVSELVILIKKKCLPNISTGTACQSHSAHTRRLSSELGGFNNNYFIKI